VPLTLAESGCLEIPSSSSSSIRGADSALLLLLLLQIKMMAGV
jgi:hypothetical protein